MKERLNPGLYIGMLMAVLLGSFGLLWRYTATERLRFMPQESGAWMAHMQMIRTCNVGDMTVLGSSRANVDLIPRLLGPGVTNLAMSGATPIEAYYEARKIYACPRPPRAVVMGFTSRDWMTADWFWLRSARFGLLNFADLQDVAENAKSLNDKKLYRSSFGSEPPPVMKNFLYAEHFPPYDFASLIGSLIQPRQRQNIITINETLSAAGQHVMSYGKCAKEASWEGRGAAFTPDPLIVHYADRLLDFLQTQNVKVLIISPPMNAWDFNATRGAFGRDYDAFLRALLRRHSNVHMVGPEFVNFGVCNFGDDAHLNEAGAEIFSHSVAPMISDAIAHWDAPQNAAMASAAGSTPS